MEIVLYFHEESEVPDQGERLRIEIKGMPDTVERIVKVIRETISRWEYWRET